MSTFVSSIFDQENTKLWNKASQNFEQSLNQNPHSFNITGLKLTSNGTTLSLRFFYIKESFLFTRKIILVIKLEDG